MTTEQWAQVEALFEEAIEQPRERRVAWVEAACEDSLVRREAKAMLAAYEPSGYFLEESAPVLAAALIAEADGETEAGERVGAYRLVRKLGRGGMGVVYLAERADGQYDHRVAVKLLRRDIRTDAFRARFLAERQILATLVHPHIARLLDGGVTAEGRPFYVMEYVEGRRIERYCDEERLPIDARLRLFLQVCEAVSHAHRSLVVHRDLKPSNILVTADGQVKLLDFGIATLLDADSLTAARTEQRLLTPAYAAPEQVQGHAITTATDVYALGVLLYELLTGHRPFHLKGQSRREVEQAILAREPTAPSAVVERVEEPSEPGGTTETVTPALVSQARATEPGRLRRRLGGDLDRIVLKALRKEPHRRYAGAEALGRDVLRHLDGLPVEARPATLGYRMASFVRRHRTGVAVTAAVVVLTVAMGLLHTVRMAAERDRAEAAAVRATHVSDFLTDMLARADDPTTDVGALLRLFEPAIVRADSELAGDPETQAAVYFTLGRLYDRIGRPDRAETLLQRSLTQRQALHPEPHPDVAASLYALGQLRIGELDSARVYFQAAAEQYGAVYEGDHTDRAWSLLQWARMLPPDDPAKRARFEEALAMLRRLHGARSPEVATALHEYYVLGFSGAEPEELEAAFREALAIYRENGQERHPYTLSTMYNLGLLLERRGAMEEAFALFREAIRVGREVLPPGTTSLNTMMTNYGASLHEQGRFVEADSVLRSIASTTRHMLPDSATAIGHSHYWYGRNLIALDRLAEAETALRTAERIFAYQGGGSERHHRIRVELATALLLQGQRAEAERLLVESVAALKRTPFERLALERLIRLYDEDPGRREAAAPYRARLAELGR